MTATISKWGNSQGLRFPKDIMKDLHLAIGDKVNIFVKDNKAVIEPIKKEKIHYTIEDLVSQIPADYKPTEEFTSVMAKEEW